jgi:5S rRNA maturation endonuclease (ribonuclease M5)
MNKRLSKPATIVKEDQCAACGNSLISSTRIIRSSDGQRIHKQCPKFNDGQHVIILADPDSDSREMRGVIASYSGQGYYEVDVPNLAAVRRNAGDRRGIAEEWLKAAPKPRKKRR